MLGSDVMIIILGMNPALLSVPSQNLLQRDQIVIDYNDAQEFPSSTNQLEEKYDE